MRFLTIEERDGLDTIRGETTQVNLHILRVVNLDSVKENSDVLTSQTADIDGFQTTHATVVFDLNASKMTEDISYLGGNGNLGGETDAFNRMDDRKGFNRRDYNSLKRIRLLCLDTQRGGYE